MRWMLFVFLCVALSAKAESPIRCVLPDFKPYTYEQNGRVVGIGVDKVTAAFTALNKKYELYLVPNYGRALAELQKGRADAMFLASENQERNKVAQFSDPVVMNRWSWFSVSGNISPRNPAFKTRAQIGAILNTNTHRWLEQENYPVFFASTDMGHLIKNLARRRLDAVFGAELVLLEAAEQLGGVEGLEIIVEIEKPFGVYFSKAYLADNTGFLSRFNAALAGLGDHQR